MFVSRSLVEHLLVLGDPRSHNPEPIRNDGAIALADRIDALPNIRAALPLGRPVDAMLAHFNSFTLGKEGKKLRLIELAIVVGVGLGPVS